MAVTVAVRVLDPTGWLGSDDAGYYSAAEHVVKGVPIQRVHHHYGRLAVVLPVAASIYVFGDSASAVALPTIVTSVLCVACVVLLGRAMFGWWPGLFAGSVVSVLPYFRVLSTTTFPDVYVCLWTTVSMLSAVTAVRAQARRASLLLWATCGFSFGIAVSAKVFAIATLAGILWVMVKQDVAPPLVGGVGPPVGNRCHAAAPPTSGGATFSTILAFALGVMAFQLLDGLFYAWAAGDFFFSLKATRNAQNNVPSMSAEAGVEVLGFWSTVWDRVSMLLHTRTSGWGLIGAIFWPVLLMTACLERRARPLVAWALAAYVLVAFVPVSFKDGARTYPIFHGRHVLPACVPFALCLGWVVHNAATLPFRRVAVEKVWGLTLAAIVGLAFVQPRELNGFRDRATGRVGQAIERLVESTPWDDTRNVFMTPSTYWRFRVLFPPALRDRLRVAVDAEAPDWWANTCPDIADRAAPLPPPSEAYLIATPAQLRGVAELWDYGVTLPNAALSAWQACDPLQTLVRQPNRQIAAGPAGSDSTVLLLLGGDPTPFSPGLAASE